jgi:hypothetical protein
LDRAELPFLERADVRPLREELSAILAEQSEAAKDSDFAYRLFQCAIRDRDPAAVNRALASIPAEGLFEGNDISCTRKWFAGVAARAFNDTAKAHASFTAARPITEKLVRDQPDNGSFWSSLGQIAALGRKEEAVRESRRACELVPLSKDALVGPGLITNLAIIYAWTGENDLAIEQLAISEQTPNRSALRRIETGSSMGLAPRRSALRENRRLSGTKVIL